MSAKAMDAKSAHTPPLTDYACMALICVLREFAWGYAPHFALSPKYFAFWSSAGIEKEKY